MNEKYVKLFLENGFKYEGKILNETETELTIEDLKEGKTTFQKAKIMVRYDE